MNPILISIGPISIAWYSVFILLGIILGWILINKESKKQNISSLFINDLIFWCIITGILGARLYYVLFNLDYYSLYPSEILMIWNGGLAIHGGIVAGLITAFIICKKKRNNFFKIVDIMIPSLILAQGIGRWGNFFNQEAHGSIVSKSFLTSLYLPSFIVDGMYINGNYYHPTFLYESIFCIVGFIILIILRKYKKLMVSNLTSFYLIWYGILRFFIESLRTDSLMFGNFKIAQIVSITMIIIGIILFIFGINKKSYYNENDGDKNV